MPPQQFGRMTRTRALGLAASAALHVAVAAILALWQDVPPPLHEPPVIQVELVSPEALPARNAPKPAVKPRLPEPAFVEPTPEVAFAPPLRLDPSLMLDSSRDATFDKAPLAKSGDLARGDPLQNYAIVAAQMVQRHAQYPASAIPRREKGIVTVSLELARDGSLLDVHAHTDNRRDFAAAAIAAAHTVAPFPPFPLALNQPKIVINFAIFFQYQDTE